MKFSAKPAEGAESYLCFSASNKSRYIIRQIMRLSLIITILITTTFQILFASNIKAQGSAQVQVTMELKNESVLSAIKKIEQQTNFRFIFRNSDIKDAKNLSVPLDTRSVKATLNLILRGNGLTFSEVNNKILIARAESHGIAGEQADAKVTGIVLDDEGNPLSGVTIMVKGDNSSSSATDLNGHFNITIPSDGNQTLVFSYIGFKTQEVPVGTSTSLKVTMVAAPGSLQEVVVLGYSAQKKSSITGSVATVSGAELRQSPAANISNSLVGRLPGLIAFQGSGQPGRDDSRLLIRGISSPTNSSPLIVIDGVPQEAVNAAGGQINATLPHIDPSDIESISILKDAGTAAVYGARAANGVILITTRRGEKGKTSLNYTFNGSWQKPTKLADLVDGYQYATLLNEMYTNENNFNPAQNRGYTPEQLEVIRTGSDPDRYANTDWYSAIMGASSFQQRHNLSVNGGGDKSRYFVSGGYLDQRGLFETSGYKQYSLRSNLDADISKSLKVSLNINARLEKTKDQTAGSAITSFYRMISPLIPSKFSNGAYNYISIPSGFSSLVNGSPYLMSKGEAGYRNTELNVLEGVGSLTYNFPFIEGLSAKGTLSYNRYQTYFKNFAKPYLTSIRNDDGTYVTRINGSITKASLTERMEQRQTVLAEASLNYKRTFGRHSLDLLALYTQTENQGNWLQASRGNYPSAQVDQIFAGDPANDDNDGSAFRNARQSVVGRAAYNFAEKYFLEFSFRYDGSDVFPKDKRFGFFPSISAGWVLSEESFLKDISAINFLKIRGSYGQLGNDRIGQFLYLNTYTLGTGLDGYYIFGNTNLQALVPGVIPNVSFTWEKANITNVGFETRLFNNQLGLTADYFYKRTKNILGDRSFSIPATIGGTLPRENLSTIDNSGFEFQLEHQNTLGAITYFIKPNVTFNRNKVIYMPEASGLLPYQSSIGQSIYVASGNLTSNLGYVAEGLYQSAAEIASGPTPLYANVAPGDIRYKDINNDGKITSADRTVIGKGDYPRMVYGISLGGSYKGFDLSILLQGAAKVQKYMTGQGEWAFAGNSVPSEKHLDRWTPDNTDASYPRLFSNNSNNKEISSYWLRDGSYLRLKNLELGYNVPASALRGLKISNARFYVSGTNLFTITSLKDVDPESFVSSFGAESYLIQKLFNLGLSVKF
ncbi:TonB-dependent receptor [Pedobacter panaciterrae]|uniref:TonB-dependent receptor n=1 Tax=Pedobacter panaciterrae TaxID=363849 RepID=A0ABU8NFR3_9SPHI|nr:TonB-dependent receptor [uncultured Pedobacter sp.]